MLPFPHSLFDRGEDGKPALLFLRYLFFIFFLKHNTLAVSNANNYHVRPPNGPPFRSFDTCAVLIVGRRIIH